MRSASNLASLGFVKDLIRFPELYTQTLGEAETRAETGVFVGCMHHMPYFLSFDFLINPHLFICGVTGSGKTYLMRSLMLKLNVMLGSLILLLDFTGEYKSFVELVGETEVSLDQIAAALRTKASGILYLNLKECGNEQRKIDAAEVVLGLVAEQMRTSASKGRRTFLFLDEAWKLLGSSRALSTILREGRKYAHGLIFSSQLVEDIDLAMLSNAATLFIFRLQNKQGLEKLAKNYNLKARHIELIQKLGVGSCALVQSNASGRRDFFIIEKVYGIAIEEFVKIFVGCSMQMEIAKSKFDRVMGSVCGTESLPKVAAMKTQKGYVELSELIGLLIGCGVKSRNILAALRRLGLDEDSIAESFAVAVSSLEVGNEARAR